MLIFRSVSEIQTWLSIQKNDSRSIGFVPTMGALHSGHISLIAQSNLESEITVCSIFVNPTQFNDASDLEKYPRTLQADSFLLSKARCAVLFYPSVAEIYPTDLPEVILDLDGLDQVMEGEHRPGHFKGVVQVVHRLLDIVQPHRLYMGQKDFQQFTIIGHMIKKLNMSTQLVVCATSREPHGLAMSSRNVRLSSVGRMQAALIYTTLMHAVESRHREQPEALSTSCFEVLNQDPFKAEYVQIVHIESLKSVTSWKEPGQKAICAAVWLEGVRLIDNILIP